MLCFGVARCTPGRNVRGVGGERSQRNSVLSRLGVACMIALLGCGSVALAQAPARSIPGAVEPGRDRPQPVPPAQPNFDFTIEAPSRSQVPRAVMELHFLLRDIRIVGAVTLPPEQFRPIYAALIGTQVTVTKILDVADAIEDTYRRQGYVLAHAFVPPQRVRDGVFTINVVEGYVTALAFEGGDDATQKLLRSYLQPVLAARPLALPVLERALLLANDLGGITAAGVLRPAPAVPGASELLVTITPSRVTGGLNLDNRGSQFAGFWTMAGDAEANGVIAAGDQLAASYATSPDVLEKTTGQVRYRRPIGANGMAASLFVTVTHGEPGAGLQPLHVVTDSYAVGPHLSYPLIRSRAESLVLDAGFTMQDAKVTTLSTTLSHDQWRVLDASASYSRIVFGGGVTASLDVAQGLGIMGATGSAAVSELGLPVLSQSGGTHGNPEFTKLSGNLHYTRSIWGPLNLAFWTQGQYAFAPLVAGEQIAFGGSQIGRGYDPGAVTGDHGIGGSFELRYDVPMPDYYITLLQPYAYYETAKVWNRHGAAAGVLVTAAGVVGTGQGLTLESAGLGLRITLPRNLTAAFEWSHTMQSVPGSDNGHRANKLLMEAAVRF